MRLVNHRFGGGHRASGVINGVGYIYNKEGWVERLSYKRTLPHAYVIVYLLEGSGVYEDALTGQHRVNAGDVILLFPGLEHTYHRTDPEVVWSECFIDFYGEMFEVLEKAGFISRKNPVLSPGLQPALIAGCDELIRDYQNAQPGEETLFASRALLLLARFVEAHRLRHQSESTRSFIAEACSRLQETLERDIDIAEVARSFGMSSRAFRRHFTEELGIPPGRYRLLQRVAAARNLLSESNLTVGEIAEKLGYCDARFFSRQFQKLTGSTPAQFRQSPKSLKDPA